MFKTAAEIRRDDWITPIGSEWPSQVDRVTRCAPYDCPFTDRRRYGKVRVWFTHSKFSEFPLETLVYVFD